MNGNPTRLQGSMKYPWLISPMSRPDYTLGIEAICKYCATQARMMFYQPQIEILIY